MTHDPAIPLMLAGALIAVCIVLASVTELVAMWFERKEMEQRNWRKW
jgi:hypothetical protein